MTWAMLLSPDTRHCGKLCGTEAGNWEWSEVSNNLVELTATRLTDGIHFPEGFKTVTEKKEK